MSLSQRIYVQAILLTLITIFWGPILMNIYEDLVADTMRPYQWPFLFGFPVAYLLAAVGFWKWMK